MKDKRDNSVGVGVAIGLGIGVSLGTALRNVGVGVLGLTFGANLEQHVARRGAHLAWPTITISTTILTPYASFSWT